MAIDYPTYLPLLNRAKGREETQSFVNGQDGIFSQVISEDRTYQWPFEVEMTADDGKKFYFWQRSADTTYENPLNGGWFNMPIQTENGLQTQLCKFSTPPQLTWRKGDLVKYSGTIVSRSLNLGA